jgi:hypothetical protein
MNRPERVVESMIVEPLAWVREQGIVLQSARGPVPNLAEYVAPLARHHQRDAIPIGTAANTAIGPREWRSPTRPVLDLNSQSSSE